MHQLTRVIYAPMWSPLSPASPENLPSVLNISDCANLRVSATSSISPFDQARALEYVTNAANIKWQYARYFRMNIIEVEKEIRSMFSDSATNSRDFPDHILLRDDLLIQIADTLASIKVVRVAEEPAHNPHFEIHMQKREHYQQQQQQQQMQRDVSGKYYISKPTNVIINWRNFVTHLPETALTFVGATTSKWLFFLAALVLSKKLFDLQHIDISDVHAAIMLTLATECGFDRTLEEENLYFAVRLLLRIEKGIDVDKITFSNAVNDLVTFQSIVILDGNVRLVEAVSREAMNKGFLA